jgi:hypothetical protein
VLYVLVTREESTTGAKKQQDGAQSAALFRQLSGKYKGVIPTEALAVFKMQ